MFIDLQKIVRFFYKGLARIANVVVGALSCREKKKSDNIMSQCN
jgi:hypothetical protein